MVIDNIHLSDFSCENLFRTTLTGVKKTSGTPESSLVKPMEYLGLNKKQILFLVNEADNKYLPENQMQMLTNLLTACHLSMEDVALVNYAHCSQFTFADFIEHLNTKKFLLFGIAASDLNLPFNIPDFQIQAFEEQKYLFNPSIERIFNDVSLKSKLWGCLKKLFSF